MHTQNNEAGRHLNSDVAILNLIQSSGVALIRDGNAWVGNCPFHDDAAHSLLVAPETNHWQCDGECHTGGTAVEWVMKSEGVSRTHAEALLENGAPMGEVGSGRTITHSSVRKLESPFNADNDDRQILSQTVDFYHETLKQSPEALAFLKKHKIDSPEVIGHFKLGYSNRSLGYRLPEKNRKEGAALRGRLQRLGILKSSGHELFRGSIVVPIVNHGEIKQIYGHKIGDRLRPGTPVHTFLPGGLHGVFNLDVIQVSEEIILCQSMMDALTFWCAGYRNVTCIYGLDHPFDEIVSTFQQYGVKRVLIAFGATKSGDELAGQIANTLISLDIDAYRISFPHEMDANALAVRSTSPGDVLGELIRKAAWLGKGTAPLLDRDLDGVNIVGSGESYVQENSVSAEDSNEIELSDQDDRPDPSEDEADVSSNKDSVASVMPDKVVIPASVVPSLPEEVEATVSDTEIILEIGERRYRIRGLEKNLSYDQLKVNILISIGDALHVDTFELYSAKHRASFIRLASIELGVSEETLKRDLSKVLLKLEVLQDQAVRRAVTPQAKEVELTKKEHQEAISLLKSPDLVQRILDDYLACGVVGETTNKLVGYLAALSRKLDKPLAVMVQSSSAAGKSALMDAVLSFVPDEERMQYSAMTGQSLFYMGDISLSHKILSISEEEGASKASYALKLLQSDGHLKIASTGKDPNSGRHVTHEYKVTGPVMIFSTTTAIDVDEELLNRCLVLSVNEERAQTQAIHQWQRYSETLKGMIELQTRKDIQRIHQNAQRLLKPLKVVNPYATQLTFLDDKTRTRRDHTKYLTLIKTIALLHQYQREVKTTYCAGKPLIYVEVTPEDIKLANHLVHEILGRSLEDMPPQTWRLLKLVSQMVSDHCEQSQLARSDYLFTRKDVRAYTGWGDTQLKVHIKRLEEMEYLLIHQGGRGKQMVYELLYNNEGRDGSAFLMGLIDIEGLRSKGDEENLSDINTDMSEASQPLVADKSTDGHLESTTTIPTNNKQLSQYRGKPRQEMDQDSEVSLEHTIALLAARNGQEVPHGQARR